MDMTPPQSFWQDTLRRKIGESESTYATWQNRIEQNRQTRAESPTMTQLRADMLDRLRQNAEAAYREARMELEAWIRQNPYPSAK